MKTYMVFVEGNRVPVIEHDTEEAARQEAVRLSASNEGRQIYVLMVVDVLEPVRHHQWRNHREIT